MILWTCDSCGTVFSDYVEPCLVCGLAGVHKVVPDPFEEAIRQHTEGVLSKLPPDLPLPPDREGPCPVLQYRPSRGLFCYSCQEEMQVCHQFQAPKFTRTTWRCGGCGILHTEEAQVSCDNIDVRGSEASE